MFIHYLCPVCGRRLDFKQSFFLCHPCQRKFDVMHDILFFNKGGGQPRKPSHETSMNELNWESLSEKLFNDLPSDDARAKYARMFFAEMQAGWKYLTDLSHAENALVIGSGTGISSLNIRRSFRNVFVLDTALTKLILVQKRSVEKGFTDINIIAGGDTNYLPFPSNFFDLICVNGVLEQVPLNRKDDQISVKGKFLKGLAMLIDPWLKSGPLKIQVNFLNEIDRILKSNGTLYLAAENRFNYHYFIKTPDRHSNLMYASLMPRLFVNLYSLLAKGERYRSFSHSYRGLRKILKRCNFEQTDFYSPKPDHRLFQEIIFLDKKNTHQINGGSIKERVKDRLSKSKYLCPSFGIVARKKGRRDNFVQAILKIVTREFEKKYELNRYHTMMKGNVVLDLVEEDDPMRGFIVKIAIDDIAEDQNRKNYDMLSSLQNDILIPEKIRGLIPRPSGKHIIDGQNVYLEDKMSGIQASRIGSDKKIRDRVLNDALDFIISLHKATLVQATWSEADYMHFIGNVIERVKRVGESGQDAFKKIDTMLRNQFIGPDLSLAHKHGDFSVANILLDPNEYTMVGVIDWDNAERKRPIVIDLINLIESTYNNFKDMELGRTVTSILLKNNLTYEENAILRKYLSVFGCPEDLRVPCTLLYWLYHFDYQIKYNYLIHDPNWMRENYYNVIAEIDRML